MRNHYDSARYKVILFLSRSLTFSVLYVHFPYQLCIDIDFHLVYKLAYIYIYILYIYIYILYIYNCIIYKIYIYIYHNIIQIYYAIYDVTSYHFIVVPTVFIALQLCSLVGNSCFGGNKPHHFLRHFLSCFETA